MPGLLRYRTGRRIARFRGRFWDKETVSRIGHFCGFSRGFPPPRRSSSAPGPALDAGARQTSNVACISACRASPTPTTREMDGLDVNRWHARAGRCDQGEVHPDLRAGSAVLQSGQVDVLSRNTTITFCATPPWASISRASISTKDRPSWCAPRPRWSRTWPTRRSASPPGRPRRRPPPTGSRARPQGHHHQLPEERRRHLGLRPGPLRRLYRGHRRAGRPRIVEEHAEHILTEIIFNDPQGPVTRWGNERWQLIVRWVLNAQIAAEALGITSKNVDEMKAKSTVRRCAAAGRGERRRDDGPVQRLGLQHRQAGREYGESYERTVGMASPLQAARAPTTSSGPRAGYTPPFQ